MAPTMGENWLFKNVVGTEVELCEAAVRFGRFCASTILVLARLPDPSLESQNHSSGTVSMP